ncbi:MAG: DUF1343 domain-containing protein [Flavipsychrobacter sp.]|nr:DUF1343 domain-containing protein [Flavipsychrobacter sp.]
MKNLRIAMGVWLASLGLLVLLLSGVPVQAQPVYKKKPEKNAAIVTGAERMEDYLPRLKGKRVALLVNQTSIVGEGHLLDALLERKVKVVKVFVPEHGFRGSADAGAHVGNSTDKKSGLPIISLYGETKRPRNEQLKDVDVFIYDLQDVGARFYTYISSLEYIMEACAATGKELMVLDRPNPNGHYVDGPVLDRQLRSFVGMQPVPVVYGMTAGEYARMLKGEQWVKGADKLKLTVIECAHYDHTRKYALPVAPSPNLKTMAAIYLYPSLCLFEGTAISVGRGTDRPFQQWGHPELSGEASHSFTPESTTGASKPMYEGKKCFGVLIAETDKGALEKNGDRFNLSWLIQAYQWFPDKNKFFNNNNFFEKLAGTTELRRQIQSGMSEEQIRATWQNDLAAFRKVRKKYLLYKDFE